MSHNLKKSVLILSLGLFICGFFGFIYNILLARYLSPADFGALMILFFLISMSGNLVSYGIRTYTAKKISETEATKQKTKIFSKIIPQSFLTLLILVAIFCLIMILLQGWVTANLFNHQSLFFPIFLLSSFSLSLSYFCEGIFQGFKQMKYVSLQRSVIGILKITSFILILVLSLGPAEIAYSMLIVYLIYAGISSTLLTIHLLGIKIDYSLVYGGLGEIKEKLSYSLTASLTQIGELLIIFGPPLTIKLVSTNPDIVGVFTASFNLFFSPVFLYESFLLSVLPHTAMINTQYGGEGLTRFVKAATKPTLFVGVSMVVFFTLTGQFFIKNVYGNEYLLCRNHIFLISLIFLLYLFASLFTRILLGLDKPKTLLFSWIIPLTVFPLISLLNNWDPITATCLSYILYLIIALSGLSLGLYYEKYL